MTADGDDGDKRRLRRRPIRVALIGIVLGWLVVVVVQLALMWIDARAGIRAGEAARHAGGIQGLIEGRPRRDLERARVHFAAAHRRAGGAVLAPIRLLPVVGRQLRSVDALSAGSTEIASAGLDALTETQEALDGPRPAGAGRVLLLRRLADLTGRLGARLEALDLGPDRALLPPVAGAHQDLTEGLAELRAALADAQFVTRTLADLLEGPRRYLVLGANNAEMRAGAGMVLSLGQLEMADGRFSLDDLRPVSQAEVPEGAVPLDADLEARWGWLSPSRDWRNLLASPRFDVNARAAASMWEAAGNEPVDGVLLLDVKAIQAVLAATGPVEVDGREISGDNVEDELLTQQYARFSEGRLQERREMLGAVAKATVDALDTREWEPSRLASGLLEAVRGRHVMAWSGVARQQEAWRIARVDGSLTPDSVLVSVLNRGGNKLDHYLQVRAELELHPRKDSTAGVLRLVLVNEAPTEGPRYALGPHPDIAAQAGEYVGLVAVNLPRRSTAGTFDRSPVLAAAGPDGPTRVLAVGVSVPRGEERRLVARFTLPGRHGTLRIEPGARVPGIQWTHGADRWADDGAWRVEW